MDKKLIGRCGTYCGDCEWKDRTKCRGCQECGGRPFWGECLVAICSFEKGFLHCGQCPEVPCWDLKAAYNTLGHEDNGERLLNLKNWANGKEDYLKLGTLKPRDN